MNKLFLLVSVLMASFPLTASEANAKAHSFLNYYLNKIDTNPATYITMDKALTSLRNEERLWLMKKIDKVQMYKELIGALKKEIEENQTRLEQKYDYKKLDTSIKFAGGALGCLVMGLYFFKQNRTKLNPVLDRLDELDVEIVASRGIRIGDVRYYQTGPIGKRFGRYTDDELNEINELFAQRNQLLNNYERILGVLSFFGSMCLCFPAIDFYQQALITNYQAKINMCSTFLVAIEKMQEKKA